MSNTSRSFQVQFCGYGDYVTIAQAYHDSPQAKKWRVPWSEKLKQHPEDAKLFGASNIKLWTVLSRKMSGDSSKELSIESIGHSMKQPRSQSILKTI